MLLNAYLARNNLPWIAAFVIMSAVIIYRPLIALWVFLISISLYLSCTKRVNKPIVFSAFAFCLVVYTPYVATKVGYYFFGNDKYQYIELMKSLVSSRFINNVIAQPELISFLLLKVSAELFGVNDFAFAFIYLISLALLIVSAYKISPRASVAFVALLLASSVSFNILGNAIRQGLAMGLLFLALSHTNRTAIAGTVTAALFSHFSAALFIPLFLCKNLILKLDSMRMLALCFVVYGLGLLLPVILSTLSFSWGYFEKKRDLYIDFSSSESGGAVWTFLVSLALILLTRSSFVERFIPALQTGGKEKHGQDLLFSAAMYAGLVLLFSMQVFEVFSRMYLYYLPLAMFYLAIYVYRRKSGYIRITGTSLLMAYAAYSAFKNLFYFPWFYCGRASDYVTAGIFDLGACF